MKIPITKPLFDYCEKEMILKPLETGWIVQGPYVKEFENLFAEYTGSKYARAVSNCTTALHLALVALDIKREDKVIVPSFTYVATANAVGYTGAEVVFCDIDIRTFNIDVVKLEKIIKNDNERKIKAIIPVNLFGLCADLREIMDIAKKHNLKVIEDSACGFGAYIEKKHSGTFGEIGCFSFHPRKSITTGEGGMIITDNTEISQVITSLRDHGVSKSDFDRHKEKGGSLLPDFNLMGYNYRMTDFQGAIGVCQMNKADTILNNRRKWAKNYDESLKKYSKILLPYVQKEYIHGYQSYVVLFTNGEDISTLPIEEIDKLNKIRNNIMMKLEENGIATRQGTHAVHTLGYYKEKYNLKDTDYIHSYIADRLSIALPLYASMTGDEFAYVLENLEVVFK